MSRATIFQAAVAAIVVGLFCLFVIRSEPARRETPAPVFTQRPATEQEQREWTEEQLYERLRRQQEEANR